jgi:hypothetical protein
MFDLGNSDTATGETGLMLIPRVWTVTAEALRLGQRQRVGPVGAILEPGICRPVPRLGNIVELGRPKTHGESKGYVEYAGTTCWACWLQDRACGLESTIE